MRYLALILVAAAVLLGAAPASAHGLIAHHPAKAPLPVIERSQRTNLAYVKYLCNHGRHATKAWGCAAVKWLTRELHETEAALHPAVQVATSSHHSMWNCIHSKEGAWNANTGNGYYGGLQATSPWYGVARMDLLSPAAQIAHAEAMWANFGYALWWIRQQWPNTSYGCI